MRKRLDPRNFKSNQVYLIVEGKTDKAVIEAFLQAGEKDGLWNNWRTRIAQVEYLNGSSEVIEELDRLGEYKDYVWGLIDRDWRSDVEIGTLETRYSNLLVLPRTMIENYFIDPAELQSLCSDSDLYQTLDFSGSNHALEKWVSNGAMWQTLYLRGADDFCQNEGYPKILREDVLLGEDELRALFTNWHEELNPSIVMPEYIARLNEFIAQPENHYTRHIYGKNFFDREVYHRVLNRYHQQERFIWLKTLAELATTCPPDIAPILQRLF